MRTENPGGGEGAGVWVTPEDDEAGVGRVIWGGVWAEGLNF